jgi:NitT/TauT family transport system ATP-binding protein
VTHDIEEAIFLGDRICIMGVQPGHIKSEIPINLRRPRHFDDTLSRSLWTCTVRSLSAFEKRP